MQLILLSEPVWIKICGEIDEISRKVLITGVIGYDSIRKHLHIKERIIPSYIHLTDMHIFLWNNLVIGEDVRKENSQEESEWIIKNDSAIH